MVRLVRELAEGMAMTESAAYKAREGRRKGRVRSYRCIVVGSKEMDCRRSGPSDGTGGAWS
jgi:hypothetical protein